MSFPHRHLSIRAQLLLLVLAVALPAAGIISYFLAHDAREASESAYAKANILAVDTAGSLDLFLREHAMVMARLAARPLVKRLDPRHCDPMAAEYLELHPEFTRLVVRDVQAAVICSARPGAPTREQTSARQWFWEGVRSGGFSVGEVYLGQSSGRWVSVLSYPVRNDKGDVSGLISFSLDLHKLNEQVFHHSPTNAVQAVLNHEDKFVLRSIDPAAWIGKPFPGPKADAAGSISGGAFSALDVDGVQRLYAVVTVPATGWRVVVGLPEDEVFAEYRNRLAPSIAISIAVLVLVLVLAWRLSLRIAGPIRELAGTAAMITCGDTAARARVAGPAEIEYVAQHFNAMLDYQDYQREQRTALVSHYGQLLKLARDIFLLIDPSGNVVEVNEAAVAAYGYSMDELRGMNLRNLRAPEALVALDRDWQATVHQGGALFETVHRRKDGSTFPVEVSSRVIEIEDKPYRQSFIRDISERRAAEAHIRRLNSAYATLSETNEAIVRLLDTAELFKRICRIAVEFGGYVGAWIGLVDEQNKRLVPAAIGGAIDDYVRQIKVSTDPAQPEGRGPTGIALRLGKPYYCQDFNEDPIAEPWRDLATRFGIRSLAALPLRRGGAVVGTLNLYSAEPGVFDVPMRSLLEEMAMDISFALDNFDRETARRQAEDKLSRSEAYYRGLFENMREGLAYCNMIFENGKPQDFIYLAVNDSFERLTGLRNVIGRRVTELIPGISETNPELFEIYGRVASTGNAERFESYVPGLDTWFSVSVYRPEPGHFVAVFDNITQRKQAEEALGRSEARFRAIVETAHDAFILVGERGELLDINQAASDLSGYGRDRLLKMTLRDLEALQSDEEIAASIARVIATGYGRFEGTWRHADGRLLNIEVSTTYMGKEGGGYFFSFIRNITERKQVEQRLREGEARFRSMLEQNISAVFMIEDGVLTYANRRAGEILGYPPEELVGKVVIDLIAEADRPGLVEATRQLLSGERKTVERDFSTLRKDGTITEIGAHATLAVLLGKKAILGIAQDIGERKKAQAEINQYITRLENSMQSTLTAVSLMVELRDPYTAGHERRVGELAAAIGTEMGLSQDTIKGLRLAGYVHDIGKISVPAELLAKPSRLTPTEFELIKGHSQSGYDVLQGVDFPWPVAEVILQHHERLDGSGYPRHLRNGEIILEARIMAVADVVEAMCSHRPYRPGLGMDAALAEIAKNGGKFYDPQMAAACLRLFRGKGYVLPA